MTSPKGTWSVDSAMDYHNITSEQSTPNKWQRYPEKNYTAQYNTQDYATVGYLLSSEAQSMELQYWKLDGPIIQPIPDNLMVGDYIEINGFCRGPEVIVELLTDANASLRDTGMLPLRIILQAGGPVQVMSQNREKVQKRDHFVKNGIQDNLAFELCIYALGDGYEIKLNNERVCRVDHLVQLEKVGAISMDGDADFTSIEFKDVFGEEDDNAYPPQDIQPGFMRVSESRQSSIRRNAPPILIRSSTRRSQRSNRVKSPPVLSKSQWETTADLSRPDFDVDKRPVTTTNNYSTEYDNSVAVPQLRNAPSQDSLGYNAQRAELEADYRKSRSRVSLGGKKSVNMSDINYDDQYVVGSKPSNALAGEAHRGSYMVLDDEVKLRSSTQPPYGTTNSVTGSTTNLADKNKKKRSSWLIGKGKKTGGSETDLQGSFVEGEKKKRGSIRDLFKRKKTGTPTTSNVDMRQSVSMPSVIYGTQDHRSSTQLGDHRLYLGAAADNSFVRGPIPSGLVKEPAPQIAAYVAAQKAVPEFENFSLTPQTGVLEGRSRPSSTMAPVTSATQSRETVCSTGGNAHDRKLKGTAPELADVLLDQGRAEFDLETTLTGQVGEPFGRASTNRISTSQGVYSEPPVAASSANRISTTPVASSEPMKLKGSAPEMAAVVEDRYPSQLKYDTQLTATSASGPVLAAPVGTSVSENTLRKVKGTAPEMASQLHENHGLRSSMDDNYTLSGVSQQPQTKHVYQPSSEVIYSKTTTDSIYQKPTDSVYYKPTDSVYQNSTIDVDYNRNEYVQSKPIHETYVQPKPVLVTQKSQPQRPQSVGGYVSEDEMSDINNMHSDHEFYLEVGKSAYYVERTKSLKRYRSRRTTQKEREARRSMGLSDRDSQRSSISSLKPDDPVLYARTRMGTDKAGIDSWLNGSANTYQYETSKQLSRVYAAPPAISKPVFKPDLVIDAFQMKKEDYKVKLPLPLTSGRKAKIVGHFVNENEFAESCSILITGPIGEESSLMLELWSDARFNVYGFVNHKPELLLRCENGASEVESEFTLELLNRDEKLAITVGDKYTTYVPTNLIPSEFAFVQLEPCDNASLTHLSISDTLCLPLVVRCKQKPNAELTQNLSLRTKLTADSKIVTLIFTDDKMESMKVILDFVNDGVFVHFGWDSAEENCSRHDLPFVPEQIRNITVQHAVADNKVMVQLNKKEVLNMSIPFEKPLGRIQKAQIAGDLVVFSAAYE